MPPSRPTPKAYWRVYHEIQTTPEQKQAWFDNRRGALVGDALAKKEGWKVGDKVTLTGSIYPGDWEFFVSGIYTTTTTNVDRSTLYFHWDYMNESLSPARKDQWVGSSPTSLTPELRVAFPRDRRQVR